MGGDKIAEGVGKATDTKGKGKSKSGKKRKGTESKPISDKKGKGTDRQQRQLYEVKDLPTALKNKFPTDFVGQSKQVMLDDMGVDKGFRLVINFKKQAYWMYGHSPLNFARNQTWMEDGPELSLEKLIQRAQERSCMFV